MRILLFGANGQLGKDLEKVLSKSPNIDLISFDKSSCDITDEFSVKAKLKEFDPKVVINAAAYTKVDDAENNFDEARLINEVAVKNLSQHCQINDSLLVHFSTDYVFDGQATSPITEISETNPVNLYGYSKLLGDIALKDSGCRYLNFRVSWVYGIWGNNFPKTIFRLCKENESVKIIEDQWGTPTSTIMISEIVLNCLQKALKKDSYYGLYHLCPQGKTNWYEFAKELISRLESKGIEFKCPASKIIPIKSEEYKTLAKRPGFSVLDSSKIKNTFDVNIKFWDKYLDQFLLEMIK